jgi:hypothetical protein
MNLSLRLAAGVVAAAVLTVAGAPAASASPPEETGTVPLVVGLRPGVDLDAPADRLESTTDVDVVDSDAVAGARAVTVDVPPADAAEAVAALRRDPAVRYVEPDRWSRTAAVTANDAYRRSQWGLDRVSLPGAWQRTTGSSGITVAVIDTGVSAVSDLSGALLPGRNFVSGGTNAADNNGHGTMTASVIAARGNNGTGIAGACWSCRILPVKVLGADGGGWDSDIAEGIIWAANQGADIINLSLGGPEDSEVLREAVAQAVAQGALVIAAAGNDGVSSRFYPAAIESVLAVGASGAADTRYSWSNYGGSWVDVAAPGCNLAQGRTGHYYDFCGTSSATPLVAGVAALAMASNSGATAAEVKSALRDTATPLTGGWAADGRVDALKTVQALTPAGYGAPSVAITGPATNAFARGTIAVSATASDSGSVARVDLLANGQLVASDSTAPYAMTWNTAGAPRRTTLTLVAVDDVNHVASASVGVVVDNTGPTVTVSSPTYRKRVRGQVTVFTHPSDPSGVAKVELLVGGRVVRTDLTYPFSPVWNSAGANGSVNITVRAYDRLGNFAVAHRAVIAANR